MNRLFKFNLGLWAVLLLFNIGCSSQNENVIKGKVDDVEDGTKVFVSELTKGYSSKIVDSTEVKNGSFTARLPQRDLQTLNILSIRGVNGNLQFINENKSLKTEIFKDSLQESPVTGGPANELFKKYQKQLAKGNKKIIVATDALSEEDLRNPATTQNMRDLQLQIERENTEFRKEAIENHPDLLPSLLMLFDMEQTRMVAQPEMKKLYDGLSPQVKDYFMGEEIGQRLDQAAALAIGGKAPGFSAPTPEGEELALEDALGKYTLVDFWAAWCVPCRKENPNIVKVYNKYHDKGFNVLGVSLDRSREAWLKAIEDDGLKWSQISNLRFWQDPIAKKYNIKAIPANFLLDENGVIVTKNLRGPSLERKIGELLGEEQ